MPTFTRLSFLVLPLVLITAVFADDRAGTLRLELVPTWGGKPLAAHGLPSITRLDWLLSGLELQRADGSWLSSSDWCAYFSMTNGHLTADATGVPEQAFTALRFRVGLDAKTNARTPDTFGSEHPLRPAIDTMHWGWMGGFIFMAVEGCSKHGAFSYHLANDANATEVVVPIDFMGGKPQTMIVTFDMQQMLADIDFATAPNSSHSRPGDVVAAKLTAGLKHAFRVTQIQPELYRQTRSETSLVAVVPGTHPVTLRVPERFPQMRLPGDNPLTEEGMALGARLFSDKRLSVNNSQSCASCHDRAHGFADPRQFSLGAEGQVGKRNAMALFNLGWHGEMFWDGRAKSLREQVLMPVQDGHEMNETLPRVIAKLGADASCVAEFKRAFGSSEISSERIARALEQHLLGITMHDSKFDRAVRKVDKLSEPEARGLQLFVTEFDPARGLRGADCFHCHGGMLFTDHAFHNNGLTLSQEDIGRAAVTKSDADRGKFKTPSLRNIALTAPYMHDGRFATLEEVIEHYDRGVKRGGTLDPNLAKHPEAGLQLTSQEKADLVAFLKTLTDVSLTVSMPTLSQK